jgi:thymidylate synthase
VANSFEGETADEAWRLSAQALMNDNALRQDSRLGSTREILHASYVINNPRQRWVLSRQPAINPAFAIAEVIWILLGRNDADFLNYWNPILPKFAGDTKIYHGAYGYRLRNNFSFDQIERAYQILSNNPDSRQVILQIWDGILDLPSSAGLSAAPDIPCNICSMPKIRDGKLEWLQVMRSNDLFLGSPHNFIQFTSLQEILAGWLGVEVGSYVQICDSLHCYEKDLGSYSMSEEPIDLKNTDNLAIGKSESEAAIQFIGSAMDQLRSVDLTIANFSQIKNKTDLPQGYQNMLNIVAADAARRRGWIEEMVSSASACSNPALFMAWERWEFRMQAKENS